MNGVTDAIATFHLGYTELKGTCHFQLSLRTAGPEHQVFGSSKRDEVWDEARFCSSASRPEAVHAESVPLDSLPLQHTRSVCDQSRGPRVALDCHFLSSPRASSTCSVFHGAANCSRFRLLPAAEHVGGDRAPREGGRALPRHARAALPLFERGRVLVELDVPAAPEVRGARRVTSAATCS